MQNTTTYYSYDVYGRVRWLVQKINGLGVKTIDYTYDEKSNVSKVYYQKHYPAERFVHRYSYDATGSLVKVETSTDDKAFTEQSEYIYDDDGSLKRKELGGNLQGIDYVYTIGGNLKAINSSTLNPAHDPGRDGNNGFPKDVFGMQLDYYKGDFQGQNSEGINSINSGKDQYNGNIKAIRWHTKAFPGNRGYVYDYESHTGWLKAATYGAVYGANFTASNSYQVSNLSYDKNGNILSLYRKGPNNTDMDELNYHYNKTGTNQLTQVTDNIAGAKYGDITSQPADNYTYNAIGQMTANRQDGHYFRYDVTGKVTSIYKNSNHTNTLARYGYDDRGFRVKKIDVQNNNTTSYVRDAAGSILAVYNNKQLTELPIYGAGRLGMAYKTGNSLSYNYELSDHLGNVRAVIQKSGNNVKTTSATDYYPYGWSMPERKLHGGNRYRFGYQGQFAEEDSETGYNQFEARLWDGRIGRWLTTDPAGQYYSSYLGMGNDPVNGVDPDGRFKTRTGRFLAWIGNGFQGKFYDNPNSAIPSNRYGIQVGSVENGEFVFTLHFNSNGLYSGRAFKGMSQSIKDYEQWVKYDSKDFANRLIDGDKDAIIQLLHSVNFGTYVGQQGQSPTSPEELGYTIGTMLPMLISKGQGRGLATKLLKYGKGGRLPTPRKNINQFTPTGSNYTHKKTGAIYRLSITKHREKHGGWKIYPKNTTNFNPKVTKNSGNRLTIDKSGNILGN